MMDVVVIATKERFASEQTPNNRKCSIYNGQAERDYRDGYRNKPWVDGSPTAAEQFLNAQSAWEPTWGEGDTRGMTVKSVKLFSRTTCSG